MRNEPAVEDNRAAVGQVHLQPEAPAWEEPLSGEGEAPRWTPVRALLAVTVLIAMAAVLLLLLWGAFQISSS